MAARCSSGIDPRFIVTMQGKPFVRFTGLLQMAHERGLVSVTVEWTYNDADLSLAHAVAVLFPAETRSVAQLVEQRSPKPPVGGSSPS